MDDTMEETFYLVIRPYPARVESFPKNLLSIDIQLGKYFADATDEERPVLDNCLNGLRNFLRSISSFGDRLFDQQYRNPTLMACH